MNSGEIEFRILGPVEVRREGEALRLRSAKQRGLLALLLLHANQVVSNDRLVDGLWGEEPPETAVNTLQVYVSQLRKLLPPDTLLTQAPGYLLKVEPDQLDLQRFERLAEEGRRALAGGDAAAGAAKLREGLALWHGQPLADFTFEPFAQAEITRLEELRVAALEDRVEAELKLGRHGDLVGELEALIAENPLRERLRGQLILALYRAGRQAEALEEYQKARATLVDELGIDPSPALQQLEKAILVQDPALGAPTPAEPAPRAERLFQLPKPPTPLVGREQELARAGALLRRDDVRLLTLTGPGGIGKTRLALEVARELGESFEEGAVFIALSPILDPALVGPTIAHTFGIRQSKNQDVGEAIQAALRERSLLLVLDNFEQVLEGAAVVSGLLAGTARLKMLVTSRAGLHLAGEHELLVPPLRVPDRRSGRDSPALLENPSVALFVQRAEAVKQGLALTDDAIAAVAEICARLEGLPLAIELAAARTKLLPPQAMLARLSKRLDLLTSGSRDAPERQQTLRTTIDWSYELLGPEDERLFARFSVFVSGFSLEAAEAVCEEDADVLEGLASLVDKSLLRQEGDDEPRFAMLEVVREYALERLAASGEEDALRQKHMAFFLQLAELAEPELNGPEEAKWFVRLELEHDNLRAAITFALESGDADAALRIAAALRRFWQIHSHLDEGKRLLSAAHERAPRSAPVVRAKALNGLGIMAGEQGDYETARGYFEASLKLARKHDIKDRIASALTNLGTLALYEEEYDRARKLYEESVSFWQEANPRGSASALENLGVVAFCQGDFDRAVTVLEDAENAAREAGAIGTLATSLRSLARALLARGEVERPLAALQESLALSNELGDRHGIAEALEIYGGMSAAQGDPHGAVKLFGAADALREAIGAQRLPDARIWSERAVGQAKAQLDEESFAAEYESGRRLGPDEAIALGRSVVAVRNRPAARPAV